MPLIATRLGRPTQPLFGTLLTPARREVAFVRPRRLVTPGLASRAAPSAPSLSAPSPIAFERLVPRGVNIVQLSQG